MAETSQEDVIAVLTDDHHKVRGMIRDLHNAQGREAAAILDRLQKEFHAHSKVEEEIVYPAYRDAVGTEEAKVQIEESETEHYLAEEVLKQLVDLEPDTPAFQGKLAVFKEAVEHHMDEEEDDMFPLMRRNSSKDHLGRLAEKVLQRKDDLLSPSDATKEELYEEARRKGIHGRSTMNKQELRRRLGK